MQKVKIEDITQLSSKTGEIYYNIKVNVSKKKEVSPVLEKLLLTLRSLMLFKQLTKIMLKIKILIQGVLIFFKKPNTSLKIIKLTLSIFLKNLKIFLKNRDLK